MNKTADSILEHILQENSVRDPRIICREKLQELKKIDSESYQQALVYYNETLLPAITKNGDNCLTSWQKYGCFISNLQNPGTPVEIDTNGRLHDCHNPTPSDRMVLHMPNTASHRAVPITLPLHLSKAQGATLDLLVKGLHKLNRGNGADHD